MLYLKEKEVRLIPQTIKDIVGKHCNFKIKLNDFNLVYKKTKFTISQVSEDLTMLKPTEESEHVYDKCFTVSTTIEHKISFS